MRSLKANRVKEKQHRRICCVRLSDPKRKVLIHRSYESYEIWLKNYNFHQLISHFIWNLRLNSKILKYLVMKHTTKNDLISNFSLIFCINLPYTHTHTHPYHHQFVCTRLPDTEQHSCCLFKFTIKKLHASISTKTNQKIFNQEN